MESFIGNEITNCGLIALKKISELSDISIRTLLNAAEDNGLELYPYKVDVSKVEEIPLPAIVHYENHFQYISCEGDFLGLKPTGYVILIAESNYPKIDVNDLSKIKGASWAKAIGASVQTTIGIGQFVLSERRRKKDEKNRPQYEIPKSNIQALSMQRDMAQQGIPEAQQQQYLSDIERSQAFGANQLGTRKAGISGLAALNQNANDAYAQLLGMNAQTRQQNQQAYIGGLNNMGDLEAQQWQLNKLNPYYENIARREAAHGAVAQNSSNAAASFGGGGMGGMGGGKGRSSQPDQGGKSRGDTGRNSANRGEFQSDVDYGGYKGNYNSWLQEKYPTE